MHGTKTNSSRYWTGMLAAKECRVYENLQKRNLFNVLYSDPELLGKIQMSEWVKWKPCRGYGRLLAIVAIPTVLEILSLISWLADLKIVINFHLLKHCWNSWLMMMFIRFSGCCFWVGIIFALLIWIFSFNRDNCFYQCVAIVGSHCHFYIFLTSCLHKGFEPSILVTIL